MDIVVVTARAGGVLSLELAKKHLRVEHDDHDDLIEGYIEASVAWLDGPDGWLGQSLGLQTLRVAFDGVLTRDGVELPCGPISSIEKIEHRPLVGGDPVEVDEDLFEIEANRVRLTYGAAWAAGTRRIEITYVAGYDPDALPGAIQSAILLHLNILYEQPEERVAATLERARDALLSPFRRWRD